MRRSVEGLVGISKDDYAGLPEELQEFKKTKREFPVTCLRDESATDYPKKIEKP